MFFLEKFKTETEVFLESFRKETAVIRSNRPSPALVENLKANYCGQLLPIKQLGSICVIPPREIDINVWDKNAIPGVAKAIETAGLSSNIEGKLIRINLPSLTEERRQELIKQVKRIGENFRIQLRRQRDDANRMVAQDFEAQEISEDQKFKFKEAIQKEVDSVNQGIEAVLDKKIKELQEV